MPELNHPGIHGPLPSDLCYPVTWQDLSDALGNVVNNPMNTVSFWRRPPSMTATEQQILLGSGNPLPVIECSLSHFIPDLPPSSKYRLRAFRIETSTTIHVFAVPRDDYPVIRAALTSERDTIRRSLCGLSFQRFLGGFTSTTLCVDPRTAAISTFERK